MEEVEETKYPIEQGAAWLTLEALTQVKRPGVAGVWKEFSSSQRIAWKTGTSYGYRDAWAIGFDGAHVVGVWIGRPDGASVPGLSGRTAAAPLLFESFQ